MCSTQSKAAGKLGGMVSVWGGGELLSPSCGRNPSVKSQGSVSAAAKGFGKPHYELRESAPNQLLPSSIMSNFIPNNNQIDGTWTNFWSPQKSQPRTCPILWNGPSLAQPSKINWYQNYQTKATHFKEHVSKVCVFLRTFSVTFLRCSSPHWASRTAGRHKHLFLSSDLLGSVTSDCCHPTPCEHSKPLEASG